IGAWQVLSGSAAGHPAANHVNRPTSLTAMVVVSRSGALRGIGAVPHGDSSLTCVTSSICYIEAFRTDQRHVEIARTLDGGVSWHSGATLPAVDGLLWDAQISCPKPEVCFAPLGSQGLLTTTNAFATVEVRPVAMPPGVTGTLQLLSCPTTLHCAATVSAHNDAQTLIVTTNGGKTWAAANAPAIPKAHSIGAMRCDEQGGACIAALYGGTAEAPTMAALTSTDGGASWTITADHSQPSALQAFPSCGDGRNCLVVSSSGTLTFLHVTVHGQVSVTTQAFKDSWPKNGVAVSCPTGPVCFVEVASTKNGALNTATLEVTRDGGRTWTSLGTPMAPALPNDVTEGDTLSCPVTAGCIAVASDQGQAQQTWAVLSNLRHSSP
ncbi:MAG: hypothetical protein J2P28_11020, partial [Actinobacteria bacterium]|nr:hypothetical protein [Actinomycetota bacterium]